MKIFIVFYSLILLMSCSSNSERHTEKYVSPRELNSHPDKYNGQEVYVKGYALLGTNSRSLFESKERYERYQIAWDHDDELALSKFDNDCITLTEANLMMEYQDFFNGKTIIVHGVFEKDSLNEGVIDLQSCSDTAVRLKDDDIKRMLGK